MVGTLPEIPDDSLITRQALLVIAGLMLDFYGTVVHEDGPIIAGICERVDGIPLAIELAAARIRSRTPNDMAQRLQDRFRLLRGGRRGVERHQTLRAAVLWSYQLLSPVEPAVFDRLGLARKLFGR